MQTDVSYLRDFCHILVPNPFCSWYLLPFGRYVLFSHHIEKVSFSSTCSMLICQGVFWIFEFPNYIAHNISCILYQLCYRQNKVWKFKTGQFQTKFILKFSEINKCFSNSEPVQGQRKGQDEVII